MVYSVTLVKVSSPPVDLFGPVSRVAQMGCERLSDPDPNLTPLKVTGTTGVCVCVCVCCVCVCVCVCACACMCVCMAACLDQHRCLEEIFFTLLINSSVACPGFLGFFFLLSLVQSPIWCPLRVTVQDLQQR